MSERAAKHVRKFLGQRVRTLRTQRGLSQERLGDRAGLSGKFIGEVERGEKSISIDSLYRVSVALEIPLRELTDVRADKPSAVPSEETEKIFALVSGRRRSAVTDRPCCQRSRRGLIDLFDQHSSIGEAVACAIPGDRPRARIDIVKLAGPDSFVGGDGP